MPKFMYLWSIHVWMRRNITRGVHIMPKRGLRSRAVQRRMQRAHGGHMQDMRILSRGAISDRLHRSLPRCLHSMPRLRIRGIQVGLCWAIRGDLRQLFHVHRKQLQSDMFWYKRRGLHSVYCMLRRIHNIWMQRGRCDHTK